jgi:hypothetical protein
MTKKFVPHVDANPLVRFGNLSIFLFTHVSMDIKSYSSNNFCASLFFQNNYNLVSLNTNIIDSNNFMMPFNLWRWLSHKVLPLSLSYFHSWCYKSSYKIGGYCQVKFFSFIKKILGDFRNIQNVLKTLWTFLFSTK